MIKIKLADEKIKTELKIKYDAFCVFDAAEMMGYCEFKLDKPKAVIISAKCDEKPLLDGLVRQTLSYCLDNGCNTAEFDENIADILYDLRIISDNTSRTVDILDFFSKINHCENF